MENLPPEHNESNFRSVEYLDAKGQRRVAFHLSRDGFTLLAVGCNGPKALAWKKRNVELTRPLERR